MGPLYQNGHLLRAIRPECQRHERQSQAGPKDQNLQVLLYKKDLIDFDHSMVQITFVTFPFLSDPGKGRLCSQKWMNFRKTMLRFFRMSLSPPPC